MFLVKSFGYGEWLTVAITSKFSLANTICNQLKEKFGGMHKVEPAIISDDEDFWIDKLNLAMEINKNDKK